MLNTDKFETMIKLVAFILLVGLIGTCSAHSAGLAARVDEPKSKFLVPRYNITGPGPNDYECISARSSDYYGIGESALMKSGLAHRI